MRRDLISSTVSSVVPSILGTSSGGGAPAVVISPEFETITTEASATPTDQTTNAYAVPSWANAVAIYPGRLPNATYRLHVYVNDGTTTEEVECYSYQRQIIKVTPGDTLYFGSANRVGSTYTPSAASVEITVAPLAMPSSLSAPSGATGTANNDISYPGAWDPTVGHITLPEYGQEFRIDSAAGYRDFFIKEKDSAGTFGPAYHVRVNSSEGEIIRCVGREIALMSMNLDLASVAITAPTGTTIGGTQAIFRPDYTVGAGGTVTITHTGVDLDSGEDFSDALKAIPTTNQEIVLTPGTYDMSGSGDAINPTNYATAMGRNCRIRSSTGNPDDVIITGASVWIFQQNSSTKWIFEGITFDVDGYAPQDTGRAIFDVNMNTTLHYCVVTGVSSSTVATVEWRGNSGNTTTPTASFCNFSKSADDLVECNGHANLTATFVGCYFDSNGPSAIANNYQLLTCHSDATAEAWGCVFTDLSASANDTQIWPDTTSKIHLFYCRSLASDLTGTNGITLQLINIMYFCVWDKVRAFNFGDRASVWVGNRFTKDDVSTIACMLVTNGQTNCDFNLLAGNYMKCSNTSTTNANGLDLRRTIEVDSCTIECVAASSSVPLRIAPSSGPASALANVRCANSRFIAANALFEISTSANLGVDLYSCIFTGAATNVAVGASGASCLSENNYLERSGAPTNWTTRFTTDVTTFSTTDVAFDADGAANNAGSGHDDGRYGGIDIRGRTKWLGSPYLKGPVEKQELKTGIVLYPSTRPA